MIVRKASCFGSEKKGIAQPMANKEIINKFPLKSFSIKDNAPPLTTYEKNKRVLKTSDFLFLKSINWLPCSGGISLHWISQLSCEVKQLVDMTDRQFVHDLPFPFLLYWDVAHLQRTHIISLYLILSLAFSQELLKVEPPFLPTFHLRMAASHFRIGDHDSNYKLATLLPTQLAFLESPKLGANCRQSRIAKLHWGQESHYQPPPGKASLIYLN